MEYAYRRLFEGSLQDAEQAVVATAARMGFVVAQSHDIQATLALKGYSIRPLRIMELGLAEDDPDPLVSLLLPFRLHLFQEGEGIVVAALRPSLFLEVYPERELEHATRELEDSVISIVDEVCGPTH